MASNLKTKASRLTNKASTLKSKASEDMRPKMNKNKRHKANRLRNKSEGTRLEMNKSKRHTPSRPQIEPNRLQSKEL
jgi:hypothetical protein